MYFTHIGSEDVKIFHNTIKSNLNILLTDILENKLFYVEKIIENKLYRIIPLFYCDSISSSNPNDVILDNKCLICKYDSTTVINFNTTNTNNDFDFSFGSNKIMDYMIFDFIFWDSVTLSRLKDVEINVQLKNKNNMTILSEDFVSKDNGTFIYRLTPDDELRQLIFTFKYGDKIKTLEL